MPGTPGANDESLMHTERMAPMQPARPRELTSDWGSARPGTASAGRHGIAAVAARPAHWPAGRGGAAVPLAAATRRPRPAARAGGAARGSRAPRAPPARCGSAAWARDGAAVAAAGLAWRPGRLPRGMRLLSFEVAYSWQSCAPGGQHCRAAAGTTATPFAARRYVAGTADVGRRLRVTETAAEVVETQAATFSFQVIRRSVSRLAATAVRAYPRHEPPVTAFINGTPERRTASAEEYFQVGVPHANPADGRAAQWYRIDRGGWRPMPGSRVFYTGQLGVGPHQASVRTANRAGTTEVSFRWQVVPLPAPLACLARPGHPCWYPPHLARDHHPMRWDWQIGRVTPLQRTGKHAVDIYDVDGFLTTRGRGRARSGPGGRRARSRTRRRSATWTWPGRTTGRTPARRRGAGTSRPPRSATCTTATPRSAGWTSGSWTRSSRCWRSGSACAPGRGSTRSSSMTSTASTRRPPPASISPRATRRTSWPGRSTRSTGTG